MEEKRDLRDCNLDFYCVVCSGKSKIRCSLDSCIIHTNQELKKDGGEYRLEWIEVVGNWSSLNYLLIRSLSKNGKQRWEDRTLGKSNIKHFWKLENLLWQSESKNRTKKLIGKTQNICSRLVWWHLHVSECGCFDSTGIGYTALSTLRSKSNGNFAFTLIISMLPYRDFPPFSLHSEPCD